MSQEAEVSGHNTDIFMIESEKLIFFTWGFTEVWRFSFFTISKSSKIEGAAVQHYSLGWNKRMKGPHQANIRLKQYFYFLLLSTIFLYFSSNKDMWIYFQFGNTFQKLLTQHLTINNFMSTFPF